MNLQHLIKQFAITPWFYSPSSKEGVRGWWSIKEATSLVSPPPRPLLEGGGAKSSGLIILVTLLAGCSLGPDYARPDVPLPAAYSEGEQQSDATETIRHDWWRLYNDATLDELVANALQHNKDLQRAVAQIDEATAVLDQTSAALLPQVDLGASSGRSRSSTLNAQPVFAGVPVTANAHRLALSTAFEIDLWGKLHRATESARAQLLGSRYAHDVVALTLASTTTQSYFTLRSLDAQIALAEATLAARDETLSVMKSRVGGGLASELDINQALVARSDAALQLKELQRQRGLMEHQLGLLCGKAGLTIAAQPQGALPAVVAPPPGLPSSLIERRPDVHQAEQALIAANARIGYAKAAHLPTFSLTGSFGGQSRELGDLLKSGARAWSIGLGAVMPIFDSGKTSARTREAEAVQRESLAMYQKSIESAFKEVADALTNLELSRAAAVDLQTKVDAARNALRLAQLRYESGYSAYLEVLDAQRSANGAEQGLLQNQQAQLLYSIDLMKALGGGWSAEEAGPLAQAKE